MSVNLITNSPSQDYNHPDDHALQTYHTHFPTKGSFTQLFFFTKKKNTVKAVHFLHFLYIRAVFGVKTKCVVNRISIIFASNCGKVVK